MKVSTIREMLEKGHAVEDLNITVDSYKTISEKASICSEILDQCMIELPNGMRAIDFTKKYLAIKLALLVYFAHIDMDMENSFDYLEKNKVIKYIEDKMTDTEYFFMIETVDDMLKQEMELHNSVSGVLNRSLVKMVQLVDSRFPDEKGIKSIVKSVIKDVNKLDFSKAPMAQQVLAAAKGIK